MKQEKRADSVLWIGTMFIIKLYISFGEIRTRDLISKARKRVARTRFQISFRLLWSLKEGVLARVTTSTQKVGKEVIKMARVVLSGIIQDIRGSLGASTFGAWKGISYMRNKAITVSNAQTPHQMELRAFFGESVSGWRTLTPVQKALWEEYAQSLKTINSKDEVVGDFGLIPEQGHTQSGMNAYLGINQIVKGADFPRVALPPVPPDVYATSFVLIAGTSATVHLEFLATLNPETKLRKIEIWMKGWWKGAHSYIATTVDVPEPPAIPAPIDITTIRKGSANTIEEVPFATIVPCEVDVQGIIVRNDGNRSVPTALYRVKVTA